MVGRDAADHDLVGAGLDHFADPVDDVALRTGRRSLSQAAGGDESLGRSLVVRHKGGHQHRVPDFARVAARVLAVPVDHRDLVLEVLPGHRASGPSVEVHHVAVARQGAQRPLLAGAADQDRDRVPVAARREGRRIEAVVLALEIDRLAGPEKSPDQLDGLLESVLALLHRWERPAVGLVLALEPGGADAEHEAAVGNVVERSGHLRRERRVAVRVAQHQVADLQVLRDAGGRRGDGERLLGRQVLLFLDPRRRQVVICVPDAVPRTGVEQLGDVPNAVPGVAVDGDLCAELH